MSTACEGSVIDVDITDRWGAFCNFGGDAPYFRNGGASWSPSCPMRQHDLDVSIASPFGLKEVDDLAA
jgi:hypothetical protein